MPLLSRLVDVFDVLLEVLDATVYIAMQHISASRSLVATPDPQHSNSKNADTLSNPNKTQLFLPLMSSKCTHVTERPLRCPKKTGRNVHRGPEGGKSVLFLRFLLVGAPSSSIRRGLWINSAQAFESPC